MKLYTPRNYKMLHEQAVKAHDSDFGVNKTNNNRIFIAILLILNTFSASSLQAEIQEKSVSIESLYAFSIKPQPLNDAILDIIQTSGQQIIFETALTKSLQAPSLEGQYTLTNALNLLLKDTNLTAIKVSKAYIIKDTSLSTAPDTQENTPESVTPEGIDLGATAQVNLPSASKLVSGRELSTANITNSKQIVGKTTETSGGINTESAPDNSGINSVKDRSTVQVDDTTLRGQRSSKTYTEARSKENILVTLDQEAKKALYAMYSRALREDPFLAGSVTFELVIEPEGNVSDCKIVKSDLNNKDLERKFVQRMQFIEFGAGEVSQTTVRWAIDFLSTF